MSAAVVSGAAALLLEAQPRLTPAQVKPTLQLTSSRVAGAGLIEAGAGELNVVAALGLAREPDFKIQLTFAATESTPSGISISHDRRGHFYRSPEDRSTALRGSSP